MERDWVFWSSKIRPEVVPLELSHSIQSKVFRHARTILGSKSHIKDPVVHLSPVRE